MGSMSASAAAPLPRLGEVYFDVRGESRSMRLSWYADTGVAVFSIWQGGTCTGTFRLPMADLPRMIEALQRGPHGAGADLAGPLNAPRGATEPHGGPGHQGRAGGPARPGYGPGSEQRGPGEYRADEYGPGGHAVDYGPGDSGPGSRGYPRASEHGRYEPEATAAYRHDGLAGGPSGYREDRGTGDEDEPTGVYRGDSLSDDYRDEHAGGYGDGGYRDGGYQPGGGYQDGGYREDSRSGGGHPDDPLTGAYREDPPGGHWDDPLTGPYREDPRGSGHPGDQAGRGYRGESRGGGRWSGREGEEYPEDPLGGGYPEDRNGGYADDRTADYPEERLTARYPEDPLTGGYPTGPGDSAIDGPDYPEAVGNAGYPPARPYVTPLPGGAGSPSEGHRGERRPPADREESDPSSGSFPYGGPSAEPEARGRRR